MNVSPLPPRILPLEPPYEPEVAAALAKWMPPGAAVEPLKLFRVLSHNQQISERMRVLGAGLLGRHSSIDPCEREVVIDRTCARCGCEYEWGVHVTSFGQVLGIPEGLLLATATPSAGAGWTERQALLIQLVDELHDTATISDHLWKQLEACWSEVQIIELLVLVGWYHLISFVANAAHIELEEWAARFPFQPGNGYASAPEE